MASFDGYYLGDILQGDEVFPRPAPALRSLVLPPVDGPFGEVMALPVLAEFSGYSPPMPVKELTGFYFPGYNDLIIERIHITPRDIDCGIVLSPTRFEGIIWNNYAATDAVLDEVLQQNAEGITLVEFPNDLVIAAQHDYVYEYEVGTTGPTTIGAAFQFVFDLGELFQYLTGTRGVVLILEPQLIEYEQGRLWDVNIFRSQNGTERRRPLNVKAWPNRFVRCALKTFDADQLRILEDSFTFAARHNFLFGLWLYESILTEDCDGISAVIHCDTTLRELATLLDVAVYNRKRLTYEPRRIVSFTDDTITLNRPVPAAYKAGMSVVPMMRVTPEQSSRFIAADGRNARASIRFIEV